MKRSLCSNRQFQGATTKQESPHAGSASPCASAARARAHSCRGPGLNAGACHAARRCAGLPPPSRVERQSSRGGAYGALPSQARVRGKRRAWPLRPHVAPTAVRGRRSAGQPGALTLPPRPSTTTVFVDEPPYNEVPPIRLRPRPGPGPAAKMQNAATNPADVHVLLVDDELLSRLVVGAAGRSGVAAREGPEVQCSKWCRAAAPKSSLPDAAPRPRPPHAPLQATC